MYDKNAPVRFYEHHSVNREKKPGSSSAVALITYCTDKKREIIYKRVLSFCKVTSDLYILIKYYYN